jgi:hypothetical protein
MKKTLRQKNENLAEYIKQLDGQLNDSLKSDRNGNIIIVGFAAIILGLLIFSTLQGSRIIDLKEVNKRNSLTLINITNNYEYHLELDEKSKLCDELSRVSGKNFHFNKTGPTCYFPNGNDHLSSIKEIKNAIKHYKLGCKK